MPVTVNGVSCVLRGRVRETTQTSGTGSYSLDGAPAGKVTFISGILAGNFTVYTAEAGSSYETGIGEVINGSPPLLSRAQILESSNNNAIVNWPSGVKTIFCDAAAAVFHSLQTQLNTLTTNLSAASFVNRVKTTIFTSSGTLTTDADTLYAWVRVVGGGGAGGGCSSSVGGTNHRAGGGGGAGEYAEAFFTAAQLGASKGVTIGAGGTGVSGANGNNGGTTNFGSGLLTAVGGSGGLVGGEPVDGAFSAFGGSGGGGGTGGFLRIAGGDGVNGMVRETLNLQTGIGGNSVLGPISRVVGTPGSANAGNEYGGGGSGNVISGNTAAVAGGAGAAGVCIVVEFCKI